MNTHQTDRRQGGRESVVEQLRYLVLEAEALEPLLSELPAVLVTHQPFGEASVLEELTALASRDRLLHGPRLARMLEEEEPEFGPLPDAEAVAPVGDIVATLRDVAAARKELVQVLESIDPADWDRRGHFDGKPKTVLEMAYDITQADVDVLRRLTERLHEARLSNRTR